MQNPLTKRSRPPTFGRQLASDSVVMRPYDEYCARFSRQRLLALVTCTCFPIDELDRKTANDVRLRLTPAKSPP